MQKGKGEQSKGPQMRVVLSLGYSQLFNDNGKAWYVTS